MSIWPMKKKGKIVEKGRQKYIDRLEKNQNFLMSSDKNMSEISKQLNLDMDIVFVPKTISDVLTEVSMIHDFSMKSSKFDFHIHLLEEELKKVDVFKRELPYCMQLLQDAIETLRNECLRLREREEGPVLVTEELIPLQSDDERKGGAESSDHNLSDKKTWLSRVRLWTAPVQFNNGNETFPFKSRGGALVPLKRPLRMAMEKEEKRVVTAEEVEAVDDLSVKDGCDLLPNQKKQRRCWSTELHNRFVDALLHLGGPYVATPKQIREMMKVDGLTNDEVKSHLQKYRLHIRKLPSSSAGITEASASAAHSEDGVHKS